MTRNFSLLDSSYTIKSTLGKGEFAKVKLAIRKDTGDNIALKLVKKTFPEELRNCRYKKLKREVSILKELCHPNIVRLNDSFETEKYFVFDLEYVPNGELFYRILQRKSLSAGECKKYFIQLISAVSYMHSQGIVHRDLKLENLLLDEEYNLKVSDFGFANKFRDEKAGKEFMLQTSCGSPCYAAPELVTLSTYSAPPCDIWSCGVILYVMLVGYLPFDDPNNRNGENIALLYRYILSNRPKYPGFLKSKLRNFYDEVISLLNGMLNPNPKLRFDLDAVKNNRWISKDFVAYQKIIESKSSTEKRLISASPQGSIKSRIFKWRSRGRAPRKVSVKALSKEHILFCTEFWTLKNVISNCLPKSMKMSSTDSFKYSIVDTITDDSITVEVLTLIENSCFSALSVVGNCAKFLPYLLFLRGYLSFL